MKQVSFSKIVGSQGIFVDGDWIESKDQDPNGDVRLIQLADIGDGVFIDKSSRYLTSEKAKELKCTFLEPGDLLIARMPHPLGRACIFPKLGIPCITVVDVCIVRPEKKIVFSEWLKLLVNSHGFRKEINQYVTGTTRQRISRGNLEKLKFGVPPLEDQKRIVNLIDKADALRQKRKLATALLDDYLKSVFLEMFGDERNSVELGQILSQKGSIKCGPFGSQLKIGEYIELGIPVYGIDNVMENVFVNAKPKYITDEKYQELKAFDVMASDVLITRTGTVGRSCVAPENIDRAVIGPNLLKVRCQNELLLPEFLAYSFNFDENIIRQVKQMSPGATVAVYNTTNLRKLRLNLPLPERQKKFVEILKSEIKLKQKMLTQSEELETQFQALMQKAFRGEL